MGEYIFVLGRNPELSVLELKSYLEARNIAYDALETTREILLLQLPGLAFRKMIKDLGGIVKIGEVGFKNFYEGDKNKILYGVSRYNSNLEINFNEVFKAEGIKAYLKAKENINPSKSLKLDVEFLIYKDKVAKVIAVFDPREYKKRDKRPYLDPLRVSSIRLSKILINLSGAKEGDLLLDPFCGVGTILQEALLMNIRVVGIDKDRIIVNKCKENLKWLNKKGWEVINADSKHLGRYIKSVDNVATEPYLGPFLNRFPNNEEAKKIIKLLEGLYSPLFKELYKVVKGKVAIIIPWFRSTTGREFRLDFKTIFNEAGFVAISGYPFNYEEGSMIKREIWVLKRKV